MQKIYFLLALCAIAHESISFCSNAEIILEHAAPAVNEGYDLSLSIIKDGHLKDSFLKMSKEIFKSSVFVETGTFFGQTSLVASYIFDKVYTVELSTDLFQRVAPTFSNSPNVYRFQGDSPDFIDQIAPQLPENVIYWLDAHYSAGITTRSAKDTPVMEELRAIKRAGNKNAIIMIDDMRTFYTEGSDYPTFTETCELLLELNPDYSLALQGDVLIAFPSTLKLTVSPAMRAAFESRLYDENPTLEVNLKEIDSRIAQVEGEERDTLKWLYDTISWEEPAGLCHGSYNWWYGLSLLHQGEVENALEKFKVAVNSEPKKIRFMKNIL